MFSSLASREMQIPMFNVDDINMIPNNSLVRFRGMVCGQPLT
jgi:hypothetical protein